MSMKGALTKPRKSFRTMKELIGYMPLEEILKAKYRTDVPTIQEAIDTLYGAMIKVALVKTKGKVKEAADLLGISRETMRVHSKKSNGIAMFKHKRAVETRRDDVIPCKAFPLYGFVKNKREMVNLKTWKKITIKQGGIVQLFKDDKRVHRGINKLMISEGVNLHLFKKWGHQYRYIGGKNG